MYRFYAVHPKLYADKYRVLAYAKLPHMIVATSIYPTSMKGWSGTSIKAGGRITTCQSIRDAAFGKFFAGRAKLVTAIQDDLSNKRRKGRQEIRLDPRDLVPDRARKQVLKARPRWNGRNLDQAAGPAPAMCG